MRTIIKIVILFLLITGLSTVLINFFNIEYGSLNIDTYDVIWVDYNQENFSNWVPVAQTNGPYYGAANQEIIFNGSTSLDHEGTIESYEWNLGDGTIKTGVKNTFFLLEKSWF